jgi:hypothetical protein
MSWSKVNVVVQAQGRESQSMNVSWPWVARHRSSFCKDYTCSTMYYSLKKLLSMTQ